MGDADKAEQKLMDVMGTHTAFEIGWNFMNQYGVNFFFFLTSVLEKDVYFLSIDGKVLHMCINHYLWATREALMSMYQAQK